MFGFLRRKPAPPPAPEWIYRSAVGQVARIAALLKEPGALPVVACAFDESRRRLAPLLAAAGHPLEEVRLPGDLARQARAGRPLICSTAVLAAPVARSPYLPPLRVIVAQRHALRAHDDAVVEFARDLADSSIVFVLALDDEVLGRWTADVGPLLDKLGVAETEVIEHPLVSRAIAGAQQKNVRKGALEHPAASADEWFRANAV